MTINAYINPDFGTKEKLIFFLLSLGGTALCLFLVTVAVRLSVSGMRGSERKIAYYERARNKEQRFYELIISGTSVMSFACAYVIINHIYSMYLSGAEVSAGLEVFLGIWRDWKDFVLLFLICLSCVINSILDKLLIPLKHVTKEEKASIRMMGMFYAIIILMYLNIIGDESEYSPVMMYYLGLMVGRFIYFDASFSDFLAALKNLFYNLPLLLLVLFLMGVLCFMGFDAGFLLERNYIIVGIFYTHLFILACVFLIRHSHIMSLIIRKPKGYDQMIRESEEYDDEDEEDPEYDDYGYDE